jgi:glycosyltransferase involved in cell wall biosynthesis
LDRVQIIRNKVDAPKQYIVKNNNPNLKIIFVARNRHEKRPEIFFEIAKRCSERLIPVDFLVVGDFKKNIPHSKNLTILGSIKDRKILDSYYLESDLIFITSFREGFPMVLLEAMAFGVVPISTDVGEIKDYIGEKYNNGILIQDNSIQRYITERPCYGETEEWLPKKLFDSVPNDVNDCIENFISAVQKFIENRELLLQMSKNAYNTVVNNFSPSIMKKEYLNIFFEDNFIP